MESNQSRGKRRECAMAPHPSVLPVEDGMENVFFRDL